MTTMDNVQLIGDPKVHDPRGIFFVFEGDTIAFEIKKGILFIGCI
jgi:hypothetical protein